MDYGSPQAEENDPGSRCDYRSNMGFVDSYNRAINYHSTKLGSLKWWKPIFFYILDCALVNAWVLFKDQGKDITQFDFRILIADALVKHTTLRKRQRTSEGPMDSGRHHNLFTATTRQTCKCRPGCPSSSRLRCENCQTHPAICRKHLQEHINRSSS